MEVNSEELVKEGVGQRLEVEVFESVRIINRICLFTELHTALAFSACSRLLFAPCRSSVLRAVICMPDSTCGTEARQTLTRLLNSLTDLTDLTYTGRSDLLEYAFKHAARRCLRDIGALDIRDSGWGPTGIVHLIKALEDGRASRLPSLRCLSLSSNNIGEQGVGELISAMLPGHVLASLDSITLSSCRFGPEGAKVLAEILTKGACASLKKLSLVEDEIDDQGAKYLGDAFKEEGVLPELISLDLSINPLAPDGAAAIGRALKAGGLPKLEQLSLADCELGGEGIRQLGMALTLERTHHRLETVRLNGNYLGISGGLNLAFSLRGGALPFLQSLDLSANGLRDQGFNDICAALGEGAAKELKELRVASNPLGPSGGSAVAALFKAGACAGIQLLDVQQCELGHKGLTSILSGLKATLAASSIRTLCVGANDIGEEGMEELAVALKAGDCMPKLQVLDLLQSGLGATDVAALVPVKRKNLRVLVK